MRAVVTYLVAAAACLAAAPAASAQESLATEPEAVETAAEMPAAGSVYDPWEGFNRGLFAVHESVDKAVLEPVARGYRAVTTTGIRSGVSNFLSNLRSPVIFVNDALQAEPSRAATTAARFGINSTVGVLGVFDVASRMGLERHDEDFGQTLAVWGVGSGPYLFIPILGPSNVRDGFGRVVDVFVDPLTYAEFQGDDTFRATRGVMAGVSAREALLDVVADTNSRSLDPYVTYRTSYGLLRESAINNGAAEDLPDFDAYYGTEEPLETSEPEPSPSPAISEAPSSPVQAGAPNSAGL